MNAAMYLPRSSGIFLCKIYRGVRKRHFLPGILKIFLSDYQTLILVRKNNYQKILLSIKIDIPLIYQQRKTTTTMATTIRKNSKLRTEVLATKGWEIYSYGYGSTSEVPVMEEDFSKFELSIGRLVDHGTHYDFDITSNHYYRLKKNIKA